MSSTPSCSVSINHCKSESIRCREKQCYNILTVGKTPKYSCLTAKIRKRRKQNLVGLAPSTRHWAYQSNFVSMHFCTIFPDKFSERDLLNFHIFAQRFDDIFFLTIWRKFFDKTVGSNFQSKSKVASTQKRCHLQRFTTKKRPKSSICNVWRRRRTKNNNKSAQSCKLGRCCLNLRKRKLFNWSSHSGSLDWQLIHVMVCQSSYLDTLTYPEIFWRGCLKKI
jgi:hypothetical protein